MKSHSSSEVVRARPSLGTIVLIRGDGHSRPQAERAIAQAFARIDRVQRLMSFHDPASELSCLNALPIGRVMRLSADTFTVLELAQELRAASGGIFDPAIAPTLVDWGYLPRHVPTAGADGSVTDIELLTRRRVRRIRPVQIDLGGIAKGYAVDVAVETLIAGGIDHGVVNAGGDLRVFGGRPHVVHVRQPQHPSTTLPLVELHNASIATSGTYFSRRRIRGREVSAVIDAATGEPCRSRSSVSVVADRCVIADALTKVVLFGGRAAVPVLEQFSASAALLDADGVVRPVEAHHAA